MSPTLLQLPTSEIKQTFLSTHLACLSAFEWSAARPHTHSFSNTGTRLSSPCTSELRLNPLPLVLTPWDPARPHLSMGTVKESALRRFRGLKIIRYIKSFRHFLTNRQSFISGSSKYFYFCLQHHWQKFKTPLCNADPMKTHSLFYSRGSGVPGGLPSMSIKVEKLFALFIAMFLKCFISDLHFQKMFQNILKSLWGNLLKILRLFWRNTTMPKPH